MGRGRGETDRIGSHGTDHTTEADPEHKGGTTPPRHHDASHESISQRRPPTISLPASQSTLKLSRSRRNTALSRRTSRGIERWVTDTLNEHGRSRTSALAALLRGLDRAAAASATQPRRIHHLRPAPPVRPRVRACTRPARLAARPRTDPHPRAVPASRPRHLVYQRGPHPCEGARPLRRRRAITARRRRTGAAGLAPATGSTGPAGPVDWSRKSAVSKWKRGTWHHNLDTDDRIPGLLVLPDCCNDPRPSVGSPSTTSTPTTTPSNSALE